MRDDARGVSREDQTPNGEAVTSQRIRELFRAEERAGLALAGRARIMVLVSAGLLLLVLETAPGLYYYEGVVVVLALLGLAHQALAKRFRAWVGFVFVALDAVVLVCALVFLTVHVREGWPAQVSVRTAPVVYFFLLIAYVAVSYSPAMMLWAGVASAVAWGASIAWVALQPGTVLVVPRTIPSDSLLTLHRDPGFVDMSSRLEEMAVLVLCAAILAFVVRRSRQLVIRQASAARERANLARYFSPTVVEQLAGRDEPLGPVRRQEVAVLFADIVGFTAMAEATSPEETMGMLREFHGRMEREVFAHRGTLEKFIGDAMLATFGVPDPSQHEASDALSCAYAMLSSVDRWNEERSARGQSHVRIGIGGHFGPVVLGDIGTARNMAFAAVGDTMNTTSRLQTLTRALSSDMVVSDALVRAIGRETVEAHELLRPLEDVGAQPLRGRQEPVSVYVFRSSASRVVASEQAAPALGVSAGFG